MEYVVFIAMFLFGDCYFLCMNLLSPVATAVTRTWIGRCVQNHLRLTPHQCRNAEFPKSSSGFRQNEIHSEDVIKTSLYQSSRNQASGSEFLQAAIMLGLCSDLTDCFVLKSLLLISRGEPCANVKLCMWTSTIEQLFCSPAFPSLIFSRCVNTWPG